MLRMQSTYMVFVGIVACLTSWGMVSLMSIFAEQIRPEVSRGETGGAPEGCE